LFALPDNLQEGSESTAGQFRGAKPIRPEFRFDGTHLRIEESNFLSSPKNELQGSTRFEESTMGTPPDSRNSVNSPNVLKLIRPFDPLGTHAEEDYDAVAGQVNRIRGRRSVVARELAELERQFIDNHLIVRSGPRRDQPLTRNGRRRRLARLLELGVEYRQLNVEERFASENLDRMNEALDRWARETYGV